MFLHLNIYCEKLKVLQKRNTFSGTNPAVISFIYSLTTINCSLKNVNDEYCIDLVLCFLASSLAKEPHRHILSYNLSVTWRGCFLLRCESFMFCNKIFLWEALPFCIWNDPNVCAYFHIKLFSGFQAYSQTVVVQR